MRVIVTGASGFIGKYLVSELAARGHEVLAVVRNVEKAMAYSWPVNVELMCCDIHNISTHLKYMLGKADALMHLAWSELNNYKSLSHFEKVLPADYSFLKDVLEHGCKHLVIAGTCFEYGIQNGCLSEDMPVQPTNAYAVAKDTLRKFLEILQAEKAFTLQWARLFYISGTGQSPNSLFGQLERSLTRGDVKFSMSLGEQLRDYLPVEVVARKLAMLLESPDVSGVVNICSGKPKSVRALVEEYLRGSGKCLTLQLGDLPYSTLEPMAFWGDTRKFDSLFSGVEKRLLLDSHARESH